jgi:prepilin peptidase CpaA
VATIVDVRTRRIPNELTAAMAATGLGLAATGMSGVSLTGSAIGLALGFALMLPGHIFGGTGAGDVKLMAAIGAIVGPATVVTAFFFTAIAGGVLALAVAAQRRRLSTTLAGTGKLIAAPIRGADTLAEPIAARRFAYGPAIAIGSVLAVMVG